MSSSNNDLSVSTGNDSSIVSSSSQLNSDPLLTPPKQQLQADISSQFLLSSASHHPQQQYQQAKPLNHSNSSLVFFNEDIVGSGTPISSFNHQFPSTAPPFLPDDSILRTETPDLDIEIALGDLNLDDYNDFLSQNVNFNANDSRSSINLGSATPLPANQSVQILNNPSTPTWSSVVNAPQSAPPFNHSSLSNSNPMLANIKSFQLPDADLDIDTKATSESPIPNSHKFGGSLLSSVSGISMNNMVDAKDAPKDLVNQNMYSYENGFPLNNFGPPSSQMPMPIWGGAPMDHNELMMAQNFMPNPHIPTQDMKHNRQNQQHHHRHHSNRWNNNGVNVHRNKMNNHRRKGEDPSKYTNARLEDFVGDIYSLCKDQHGCRFLQKQLDMDDATKSSIIFNETEMHIVDLMVDPFGNYLIQKLLEKCNPDQRIQLIGNASSNFFQIATNPHGTRALQKLIECISTDEESKIVVESLKDYIVTLSKDLNGNHVVQKCLAKLSQQDSQFIFDVACSNCVQIASHRHGCCVLQRCLDYGSLEQCSQLGSVLADNVLTLSFDPFGNYVIQYILNNSELIEAHDESIDKILLTIRTNFIDLSLHKFGSNVIEKILRIPKINSGLVDLVLKHLTVDDFARLLNDSYGNYVSQTCLDVIDPDQFDELKKLLVPILPSVKNTPHGRRISSRLGINLNALNNPKNNVVSSNAGGVYPAKVQT